MNAFLIWVLPIVGGLLLYALTSASVKAPGQALNRKFVELGTLQGRSLQEIVAHCGNYKSYSTTIGADGKPVKIIQWMETSYHIVLLFDENDICLGVSSETSV